MNVEAIIIGIHVLAAIAITGLVLIQRGKGSEIGAAFGSGASQTMFGTMGSGNFLTKSTTLMATVFFATSLGLAIIAKQRADETLQDNSLISGDIEQISSEISNSAPQQAPTPADPDIPAVQQNTGAGDIPVAEAEEDVPVAEEPEASGE